MSLPVTSSARQPADNAFAESLRHISPRAPRAARELPGLQFKKNLAAGLFPLGMIAFFSVVFPLMILQDPQFRASRIALKNAPGTVMSPAFPAGPASPPAALRGTAPQAAPANIPTPSNTPGPRSYVAPAIQYRFRVPGGATYYGSAYIEQDSVFAKLKTGAPLPIAYDPANPGFNGIAGVFGKNDFPIAIFAIIPFFFLAMFAPLFLAPLIPALQARRIFQKGELATGHVVFVSPVRAASPWHGAAMSMMPRSTVTYTFQDQAGETIRGSQVCDNQWMLNKLEPGTEITVAYLWKKSSKNMILEPFIG